MLSIPDEFRDPAALIKEITEFNKGRTFSFDYSSRYSVEMPSEVFPYGITYRTIGKDYVDDNLKIWRYLVTRGLLRPSYRDEDNGGGGLSDQSDHSDDDGSAIPEDLISDE